MPKADQEHNPPDMDRHGLLGATDHPQKKRGSQDLETLFNTLIISGTFMSRACYSYMKPIAPTPPHGFLWGARLYFIHQGTVLGRCRSRPRARSYHQRKCIFLPVTNGNRWPSDQRATPDGEFPRKERWSQKQSHLQYQIDLARGVGKGHEDQGATVDSWGGEVLTVRTSLRPEKPGTKERREKPGDQNTRQDRKQGNVNPAKRP